MLVFAGIAMDYRQWTMDLPHRKDYYFFFLVKKGNSRLWVDFLSYQVQPHHLYSTLPHQVHVKEKETLTSGLLIAFTEEFIALCNDETIKQLPILQNKHVKHAIFLTAKLRKVPLKTLIVHYTCTHAA